jgi:hypothetical protein
MNRKFIYEIWEKYKPVPFYLIEGFDDCITDYDVVNSCLIYSKEKIFNKLIHTMTIDESIDYFENKIMNHPAIHRNNPYIIISSELIQ